MRNSFILVLSCILMTGAGFFSFSQKALAKPRKGHLLYMTLSAGYKHASVAPSEGIVKQIGERSGLFDTTVTQDVGAFTPENLKKYDVVMFYTTGELPMTEAEKNAFINFIRSGHGFVGVHSATDTFYEWEPYLELIGGYFNDHPWHQQVTVDVADPSDPIVSFLGKSFQVNDEIYQIADFQYKTSHVLLRLDPNSVNLRKPGVHRRFYGWPLAWTRRDGKGRVFYTALGHEDAVWNSQWYQELLLNGIKYAMGQLK
ncbi:MAG TPA: ThuA domain-containing protein [Terriglobia bacterium]|jgi:type 1 glutamine amidotransferase|nr:ThuA domain-containing protein [Terriglobia bacterium]